MDELKKLSERLENVSRLRGNLKTALGQISALKSECDRMWEEVSPSLRPGMAFYDDEILEKFWSIFPVSDYPKKGSGHSEETESMLDGLVRVLSQQNRWMGIKSLTAAALEGGVATSSELPHRVFSTVLSSEGSKENPRVKLQDGRWGLPGWKYQ